MAAQVPLNRARSVPQAVRVQNASTDTTLDVQVKQGVDARIVAARI